MIEFINTTARRQILQVENVIGIWIIYRIDIHC